MSKVAHYGDQDVRSLYEERVNGHKKYDFCLGILLNPHDKQSTLIRGAADADVQLSFKLHYFNQSPSANPP